VKGASRGPCVDRGSRPRLATLAILAFALDCNVVLGRDDYAVAPPPAPASPPIPCGGEAFFGWEAPGCGACVQAHCCAESTACAGYPLCARVSSCIAGCNYWSCSLGCEPVDSPAGQASYDLYACYIGPCATACDIGKHWSCVGQVGFPRGGGTVQYTLEVRDQLAMTPIVGVQVHACALNDDTCASPLDSAPSDAQGFVTLNVTQGFDGYASLDPPVGYAPSLFFLSDPVVVSLTQSVARGAPLITLAEVGGLASAIHVSRSPGLGFLSIQMNDCAGDAALGVAFSLTSPSGSSGIVPFYLVNGAVTPGGTETDSRGGGGFVNVPVGSVVVTAELAATHRPIAKTSVLVRPDTLTTLLLGPTPM
jgi:hypothetical protein